MPPSNDQPERRPYRKVALHCPNCGDESDLNGDWIIHIHSDRLDYECPECGAMIESRADGPDVITPV